MDIVFGVDEFEQRIPIPKFKNFDDPDDNTWEPSDNLGDAEAKIKQFEKDLEAKSNIAAKKESVKRKATGSPAPRTDVKATSKKAKEDKAHGFGRKLDAEKIIGATNEPGELFFLVKWKGTEEADLVPAKEANLKIPQTVIKFYEDRLNWYDNNDGEDKK